MSNSSDENLLFSMWALQIGFIDSAQLVDAAGAWMFAREKPIGQIFVEKKLITESMKSTIDEIVRKQINRTGSVDKSLESLSQASSMALTPGDLELRTQDQKLPREWEARIRELSETRSILPPRSESKRFKIKKAIGHGGLGVVSEAYDRELDRTVAIKEIRPENATNPEYRARFITEAKITGLLDHPGIVPVHAIGEFDDGRPYYAMRLIRGDNMSSAIRDLNHGQIAGDAFLQRIRPLLRHLIDACNTVEYVFMQHGLLHRDLKPSNIMIDKYGETIVVDWGLVKSTDSPSEDRSQSQMIPSHVFDSGSQPTADGQFRGTLNYMSPEQAKGQNDLVDHRSDIYGLGATLYAILIGKPPYPGTHWDGASDYVDLVRENRFTPLRQLRTDIPPALEAICMKAMATQREDRYQKASDFAEDIDRWIAGDPVSAYPEGLLKRMERWGRKHLTALGSGIVLLTGLTLGLAWMNQRVRVERDQAKISEEGAIESRKLASEAIERVVEKIGDDSLAQIEGMKEKRREMLEQVIVEITRLREKRPEDHAVKGDLLRTQLRLANIDQSEGRYATAIKHYRSVLDLIDSVPQAYRNKNPEIRDEWDAYACDASYYLCELGLKIEGLEDALKGNRKTAPVAEAYMNRNRGILPPTVAYARSQVQFAEIQIDRGEIAEAKAEVEKAVRALEPLVAIKRDASRAKIPDDPSDGDLRNGLMFFTKALLIVGRCMTNQLDLDGASKRFDDVAGAAKRIQGIEGGEATGLNFEARAYRELHLVYLKQGDTAKATSAYEKAMQIVEKPDDNSKPLFFDRLFILAECDRARYGARRSVEDARSALARAERRFQEVFAAEDSAKERELMLHLATARFAIAIADGSDEARSQAEQEYAEARKKFTESKPNSPLLQELDLSSNQ